MSELNGTEKDKPVGETLAEPSHENEFFEKDYTVEDAPATEKPEVKASAEAEAPKKKKGAKKTVLVLCLVLALAVGAFAAWYFLWPGIRFSTTRPVGEAGETFNPMSIVDKVKGGELTDVSVSGPSGELETGVYKYVYTYRGKQNEVTLTVKDTKAPVLSLKPAEELVFNDREGVDPSLVADAEDYGKVTFKLDDQGNDLTVPGSYEVIVTAEDEYGNKSSINAVIKVEPYDTEPPVISGAEDAYVYLGSSFDIMAGISVKDDKDPSPSISADANDLNTNNIGTYTVIYTAKDEYGNIATKERKVIVYQTPWYYPGTGSVRWDASGEGGQPYLVAVNRSHNTVTVYGKDSSGNYTKPVRAMVCSTARAGYNTPISTNVSGGRFHSAWRAEWCYMVDGSYGRYAISIDTSLAPDPYDRWGIMFHSVCYFSQNINNLEYDEYNKLGEVASLGCIRLCVRDEKWLYDNCPEGFPIIIYDDTSSPGPLGKPEAIKIDTSDERKGWDPTDPDPKNPWKN